MVPFKNSMLLVKQLCLLTGLSWRYLLMIMWNRLHRCQVHQQWNLAQEVTKLMIVIWHPQARILLRTLPLLEDIQLQRISSVDLFGEIVRVMLCTSAALGAIRQFVGVLCRHQTLKCWRMVAAPSMQGAADALRAKWCLQWKAWLTPWMLQRASV